MSTLGLQWLSICLKIKTKFLVITTFKTLLRFTVHQLLSALYTSAKWTCFQSFHSVSPYRGFAYAVLSAQNHIPSPFHLVNTYSSCRSLLNHHFLREAFLDFPLLGQISLTVCYPISLLCSPYYSCNFMFIYTSLFISNCPTSI